MPALVRASIEQQPKYMQQLRALEKASFRPSCGTNCFLISSLPPRTGWLYIVWIYTICSMIFGRWVKLVRFVSKTPLSPKDLAEAATKYGQLASDKGASQVAARLVGGPDCVPGLQNLHVSVCNSSPS